jgi:hypothetical protein
MCKHLPAPGSYPIRGGAIKGRRSQIMPAVIAYGQHYQFLRPPEGFFWFWDCG